MNKYLVKIEESLLPDSFTFDELIANGLLDERDEKIQVKLIGENEWVIARDYPFDKNETLINNSFEDDMSDNYILNGDGTVTRPGEYNKPRKPDSNLILSIISISICLPFGILALMESVKVDSLYAEGDYNGAQRASDNSKQWSIWSFCAWAIIIAIIIFGAIVKA